MTHHAPHIRLTIEPAQRYADLIERCKPGIVTTEESTFADGRPGLRSAFVTQDATITKLQATVEVVFECQGDRELCAEHGAKIRESAGKIGAFTVTGHIDVLPGTPADATSSRP